MRWSWRIARVAGIDIHVHATFLLLLAWIGASGWERTSSWVGAAVGIGYVLLLFLIVVLHEYGHALTARRYGIGTKDITLLPIGGVARLERMPREPRQELAIALAGPAVNVVLALLLWVGLALAGVPATAPADPAAIATGPFFGRALVQQLLMTNVFLAAFNMIPAFPMDGGRVLRALLAMRTGDYAAATARAAAIARVIAVVGGLAGFFAFQSPILVLIALFVWLGAASEAADAQTTATLGGASLERLMMTDVRTLAPRDALARAAELTLAGFQRDFPVVDESGRVIGVLTRRELLRGLAARGAEAPVTTAMQEDFVVADPAEPLDAALARLQACGCDAMPVVRSGRLLGMLSMENVAEYMAIQRALRGV